MEATSGEQIGKVRLRAPEMSISSAVIAGQQVLGRALLEGAHDPAPLLQTVVLLQESYTRAGRRGIRRMVTLPMHD